jgi:hypothetical protein
VAFVSGKSGEARFCGHCQGAAWRPSSWQLLIWPLRAFTSSVCVLILVVVLAAAVYFALISKMGLLEAVNMSHSRYGKKNFNHR